MLPTPSTPLLPAKLIRPEAQDCLPRERLFHQIDAAREGACRLLWIVAPPGYGKTTLASSYIESRALDALWVQLDGEDTDPATFLHYLGRARAALEPPPPRALPAVAPEPAPDWLAFTRHYVEGLCAGLTRPAVIVLDNYQKIPADADLHWLLRAASARLPGHVRLILLTRVEPPPVFARLQLAPGLCRLGLRELRLTFEEAEALVPRCLAPNGLVSVAADALRDAYQLSQGWAAGLILLLRSSSTESPLQAGPRDRQMLFDYLSSEFFEHLPVSRREQLLCLSPLPRITAAMADALTGSDDAVDVLEDLRKNHGLIMPRDDDATIYEFHPLVRDFLQARAARDWPPERLRAKRIAAAALLEGEKEIEAALDLYRVADAGPELAALLGREAPALLAQGFHHRLDEWLTGVPVAVMDQQPWLHCWRGQARLPFTPMAALASLEEAWRLAEGSDDATLLYLCSAAITNCHVQAWDAAVPPEVWLGRFEQLRMRFPAWPSPAVELRVLSIIGPLALHQPDHVDLPELAERGLLRFLGHGDEADRLVLGIGLLQHYFFTGQGAEGEQVASRLTALLAEPGLPDLAVRQAWVWLARFRAVHGDHDGARRAIALGQGSHAAISIQGFGTLLEAVKTEIGVYGGAPLNAPETKGRETELANSAGMTALQNAYLQKVSAMAALRDGNLAHARACAQINIAAATFAGYPFGIALGQLLLACALWRAGPTASEAARTALAADHAIASDLRSRTLGYLHAQLAALIAFDVGDAAVGRDALGAMLTLGQEAGGLNWPLFGLGPLGELYARALEADLAVADVHRWIRQLRLRPPDPAPAKWPWPVEIHSLGHFALIIDGQPLSGGGKAQQKPLELLKALIALGPAAIAVDTLTDALWPDAEGNQGRTAFDTNLHRLRRLLSHQDALILHAGQAQPQRRPLSGGSDGIRAATARHRSPARCRARTRSAGAERRPTPGVVPGRAAGERTGHALAAVRPNALAPPLPPHPDPYWPGSPVCRRLGSRHRLLRTRPGGDAWLRGALLPGDGMPDRPGLPGRCPAHVRALPGGMGANA